MIIVGIDEVGRGCWAGPLVAGAVILREPIAGLKDSKKLGPARRAQLAQQIHAEALAVGLGWVDAATIDRIGLTKAVRWAMERALEQILAEYDSVIIDGHINFLEHLPKTQAMIKADDRVPAASAASIVAKVARDQYMIDIAPKFPGYGFEKHVGYGTALHLARLQELGVSPLHRRSFKPIKSL
jgi:ribonuclease HII